MRWGSAVAALCFAALAWFRLGDNQPLLAILFAAAAMVQALLTIRSFLDQRSRSSSLDSPGDSPGHADASRPLPPRDQIARTLDVFRARRRGWLRLAGVGWLLGGASLFLFPPTGVALGAMSLFATLRFRYYDRYVPLLERALAEQRE
jgi:hypothetical protein